MVASPDGIFQTNNRTALKEGVDDFKRWLCLGCGFLYDEALGLPEHGVAPGTRWVELPDDWSCPDCGTPKNLFEMVEIPYADAANDDDGGQDADDTTQPVVPGAQAPHVAFVLRANERGHGQYDSTGEASSYISGHPNAILSRQSSFNFHEYQSGHAGFGQIRVFGDEVFSGTGCGYNIHPHHNFVICAFVLDGELTHVNTVGNIDQLHAGDFYVFSAGSGGKHTELNLRSKDMSAIYIWFKPGKLLLDPSYHRTHFEAGEHLNSLAMLVGDSGMLPIPQQVRISRLVTDKSVLQDYVPASPNNGTYVFVIDGGIECAGHNLRKRDSIGLSAGQAFSLRAEPGADVLIVETVM